MIGRTLYHAALTILLCFAAIPACAQGQNSNNGQTDDRVIIDILVPVPTTDEADARRQCPAPPPDGSAGPEIVVCGEPFDDSPYYYSGSAEAAENRYAEETAFAGEMRPPDVAGPGIFTGPPTVSGLCGFIFNPCPPTVPVLIDVTALPAAPAGSDADRIAQGLEPLGEGGEASEEELALPLPPLD